MFINLFSLKQKFNERQIKSILNQVKIVLKKKRNQNEKQILLSVSLCCAQSRVAAGSSLAVGLDLPGPEPSSASASPLQNHSNPSQQHCRHHQPPRYSCVVYADFFPSNSSSILPSKNPTKRFKFPKSCPICSKVPSPQCPLLRAGTPCVGAVLGCSGILQHMQGKHSSSACRTPLTLSFTFGASALSQRAKPPLGAAPFSLAKIVGESKVGGSVWGDGGVDFPCISEGQPCSSALLVTHPKPHMN